MLPCEIQMESRVRENFTHGLVGKVKPIRCRRQIRGFTLIELLVVITIIGILAALLLPALLRGKLIGIRARCMSNLKQIGVASYMYSDEFDGAVPNGIGHWGMLTRPYLTNDLSLYDCPNTKYPCKKDLPTFDDGWIRGGSQSYGVMHHTTPWGCPYENRSAPWNAPIMWNGNETWQYRYWADPMASIYIADGAKAKEGDPFVYPPPEKSPLMGHIHHPDSPLNSRRFGDRHLGTNCLFIDGHISIEKAWELDAMRLGESETLWDAF